MILFITVNSIKVRGWYWWQFKDDDDDETAVVRWWWSPVPSIKHIYVDSIDASRLCKQALPLRGQIARIYSLQEWDELVTAGTSPGFVTFSRKLPPKHYYTSHQSTLSRRELLGCSVFPSLISSHMLLHLGHWMSPGWLRFIWATRFDKMEPTSLRSDPLWSTPATATGINCGT